VVEDEKDEERHWERVRRNERRLLAQRRLVERTLGKQVYSR